MEGYAIPPVGRNGKQSPARPRIEVRQPASPEEAAAIAAAIEQFMRDTAPPPATEGAAMSPWLRAGLLEGTKRTPGESPWRYGFSPR
ncbi:MAG: hypothetical protein ABW142_02340 [Thermoleophilaceae bacterium]